MGAHLFLWWICGPLSPGWLLYADGVALNSPGSRLRAPWDDRPPSRPTPKGVARRLVKPLRGISDVARFLPQGARRRDPGLLSETPSGYRRHPPPRAQTKSPPEED